VTLDPGRLGLRASLECLDAFLGGTDLAPGLRHDLCLCAEELLANVLNHGSPREVFTLTVALISEGGVRLEVQDDGPPFDPLAQAPPPRGDEAGGWGITLVTGMAAEAFYRREETINVVTLVLR